MTNISSDIIFMHEHKKPSEQLKKVSTLLEGKQLKI